jgi:hypothetical protein
MSENVIATLSIPFTSQDDGTGDRAGQNKIVLQQMTTTFDALGQLWARCFPSHGVKFTTSSGIISGGEIRVQKVYEGLKFSNNAKAGLKFSGIENVTIDTTRSVLFRKTKDIYGHTTIVPAQVSLTYESKTNEVVAKDVLGNEIAIYGGCFVQYMATYQVLYYKPQIDAPYGGAYGAVFHLGTIFGYNDYAVETLDMELDLSNDQQWVEFARVTSKIVLDAKGVWEFPPNWESTYQGNKKKIGDQREDYSAPGRFEGYSHEIDPDNSFVDVRVHLIIEVNTIGTLKYIDPFGIISWYSPYFASITWVPQYECKFKDPPGGKQASSANEFLKDLNNWSWRDVFLSVDKNELKSDLQSRYPGVIFS